jgi:hypothetical protein
MERLVVAMLLWTMLMAHTLPTVAAQDEESIGREVGELFGERSCADDLVYR